MSEYTRFALVIAVGPVGSFISGGRRSRDLWYGSRLISELTRQAALELLQHLAVEDDLIVPRVETLRREDGSMRPGETKYLLLEQPDLEPWQGPVISNKIQALLPASDGASIEAAVREAERAVRAFLCDRFQDMTGSRWFRELDVDEEGVSRQLMAIAQGDFVEFYAAWAPVAGDDLEGAFQRAFKLLGARKAARVFPAPSFSRPGKPKSSLDPGRDSVLHEPDPGRELRRAARTRIQRLARGISPDERLDAIGLLRRYAWFRETAGGGPGTRRPPCPFPPLTRVAADAWLEGAAKLAPEALEEVRRELTALLRNSDETRKEFRPLFLFSSPSRNPGDERGPWRADAPDFAFDPALFFEGGVAALERTIWEAGLLRSGGARMEVVSQLREVLGAPDADATVEALATLRHLSMDGARGRAGGEQSQETGPIPELHRICGHPSSYYALLEADGDSIGSTLRKLGHGSLQKMRTLVAAMDQFAADAWKIVRQHRGVAFYVGGDELNAYLPVDRVLNAAVALSRAFDAQVGWAESHGIDHWPDDRRPTLSVGVSIAHRKDDLRAVRHQTAAALRSAKRLKKTTGGSEGHIVVREEPAGGVARDCGGATTGLCGRVEVLKQLVRDREVSLALTHDLLELHERFTRLPGGGIGEEESAGLDLARALVHQKARRDVREVPAMLAECIRELRTWRDVRMLAHEILLAARIGEIAAQRSPRPRDVARSRRRRQS